MPARTSQANQSKARGGGGGGRKRTQLSSLGTRGPGSSRQRAALLLPSATSSGESRAAGPPGSPGSATGRGERGPAGAISPPAAERRLQARGPPRRAGCCQRAPRMKPAGPLSADGESKRWKRRGFVRGKSKRRVCGERCTRKDEACGCFHTALQAGHGQLACWCEMGCFVLLPPCALSPNVRATGSPGAVEPHCCGSSLAVDPHRCEGFGTGLEVDNISPLLPVTGGPP